jgi:formate/nitrite transporter FocA (FNT family)
MRVSDAAPGHTVSHMADDAARPHAIDIYERICEDSREEIDRTADSLAFSGLFAGFAIGLAPLALALVTVALGASQAATLVAALLYPVGYVAVIMGRAQFFTENTMYPVMLVLRQPGFLRATGRIWAIVLATNLLGALIFALLATSTGALDPAVRDELVSNGGKYLEGGVGDVFFGAVVTGFLLALVAWLVEASDGAGARIAVIWALTSLVALGSFDHCIASTVTVIAAFIDGSVGLGDSLAWFAPTLLGNILGGVLIVTSINYGQIRDED